MMKHTELINSAREFTEQTGRPYPILITSQNEKTDPLDWLLGIRADEKWYWKSRNDKYEVGAVGRAYSLEDDGFGSAIGGVRDFWNLPRETDPVFLGGRNFMDEPVRDQIWSGFKDETLHIPEMTTTRQEKSYFSYCCDAVISPKGDQLESRNRHELSPKSKRPESISAEHVLPSLKSKGHYPVFSRWCQNVEHCLEAIKSNRIEKIVLARRTDYLFEKDVEPLSLLRLLIQMNQKCFSAFYQPKPGLAFISVTPERLYRREGDKIEVEALSSTLPRGSTPTEDDRLGDELLKSKKLRQEHQIVIDGVANAASSLCCREPEIGITSVMKLDRIQHLMTPIEGTLKDGISDKDIIDALHPTPAVGGVPRDAAVELIRDLEQFDRGWYAAPIGYITRDRAEFAVGIRSMLVRGKMVSVFTGAGIVDGSNPEVEWHEIDSKNVLQPLLKKLVMP